MSMDPLWLKNVFPAARISVNGESAAFADVASNPQLSSAELFALWAMDEEMSFASLDVGWHDVVALFLVQL